MHVTKSCTPQQKHPISQEANNTINALTLPSLFTQGQDVFSPIIKPFSDPDAETMQG